MKVESGIVTIVRIGDLMASHRLDPIRVTLDDIAPGQGRITIECYGKAWASYWGAMGPATIAKFFIGCDNGYLIDNLASGQNLYPTRFSSDALQALCRKTIRARRKGTQVALDPLTKDEAADLMLLVEHMNCDTEAACWAEGKLLNRIFGEDGVQMAVQAAEPNPAYDYLARICSAVREALTSLELAKEAHAVEAAAC